MCRRERFRKSLWPDEDREEWFSLGENHEKLCGFAPAPIAKPPHPSLEATRRAIAIRFRPPCFALYRALSAARSRLISVLTSSGPRLYRQSGLAGGTRAPRCFA